MASWTTLTHTDVVYAGVQFVLKSMLTCMGFYSLFTMPPVFSPDGNVSHIWFPHTNFMYALFMVCNSIDIAWHWKCDKTSMIHHIAVLSGLVLSYLCGGFSNVYVCLNGILETVGPVYNIMKCLPAHAHILRLIAIFVNMCVRFPYFIWVFRLMVLQLQAVHIGRDLYIQVTPSLWYIIVILLSLDCIWTRKMLSRFTKH